MRKLKKQFLWEKNYIVLLFTSQWHEISSENLEKVQFGEKLNALNPHVLLATFLTYIFYTHF